MKISDYKNLILTRSNDFISNNMTGTIVKTPDELTVNMYGVYIPRLVPAVDNSKGPFEEKIKIKTSKCLNEENVNIGDSEVIHSNYILLTMNMMYNMSMPKLIRGEQVDIGVIDKDIKSLYIKPVSRNQVKNRPIDVMEMYVPASGNYDGGDLTDNNKYFVRCDSENKFIRIHMSNANGEVSSYDITIDGGSGNMSLTDGNRSIIMNTNNDEIILSNEAGSTIALREDMIDITCEKLYINAKERMEINCPKTKATLDDIELISKTTEAKIDSLEIKGKKIVEDYKNCEITNKKRSITSPTTYVDGLVTVTGYICPGGVGFGAPPNKKPLPTQPQITKQGMANFKGAGGLPLVKGQPLLNLLTVMCAQLDATSSAPVAVVPPMSSTTLALVASSLVSTNVKG